MLNTDLIEAKDLPDGIREMFGGNLGKQHLIVTDDGELVGYQISHFVAGTAHLSNVISDKEGGFVEDDRQEAVPLTKEDH